MFSFARKNLKILMGFASLFVLFFFMQEAWAGFGITPPYFVNRNLTRGSQFEKRIWLTRGDPSGDLRMEVSIDVPGANEWISIDKGNSFILPDGEQKVPMTVEVDVPKRAEFKSYSGYIRLTTYPIGESDQGGQVAIVLGARIEVDLEVKDLKIFDFEVKRTNTHDLEEGHDVLWWFSPGRIKFEMEVENKGNMKASPSKVVFNIYDAKEENLLETVETNRIKKVDPFKTEFVTASLPTSLGAGSYWASFSIFKEDEIIKEGRVHLSILPRGTLKPIPREWYGLQVWVWILAAIVVILLGGIYFFAIRRKEDIDKIIKNISKKIKI